MKISLFQNAKDNEPKHRETTWESFTRDLGPHEYVQVPNLAIETLEEAKKGLPAFSPAEYRPGTERAKENVIRVWLFVADLDHLTEQAAQQVCQHVRSAGLAHVVYTSWKHAVVPWRLRIVLPLSRPVSLEEWPGFWARMNQAFGGLCDPKCVDASRLYFGPYAPAGTELLNFYFVVDGEAVDVNAVIGAAREEADPDRTLAIKRLAEAWPSEGRHEAHLALAGGLLMSGVPNEEAIEILCRVAVGQDPGNEDRDKRTYTVEGTHERLQSGERVIGWTTLAKHVGADVAMFAKQVLEAPPKISLTQLKEYAKTLVRKQNDAMRELGTALTSICEMDTYAEATNRNDVTLRLSNLLAERFTGYDAASIADLFIPSLQKIGMNSSTCPGVEDIFFAIKRKQDEIKTRAREQRLIEIDQQVSRIREAYKNGRSHPYTPLELAGFGNIQKRWIIQHDRAFYLYFNGSYTGPYTESAAPVAMARDLSPAQSAGIQLYAFTKDGKNFKQLKTLVDEYGTVAASVSLDLTAQQTVYDEYNRCVIEAPCPIRPITPRFHEDIDQWLRILAGEKHFYNLKTWIAIVTRLDIICAALFLTGRKSVGKSLLPLGLSRIWCTTGPTSLEAAFDTFNDSVLACPLTLADEQLPKNFRGQTKNAELRLHIQQRERTVRRKFMANAKLLGASRTLIAAHDIHILQTGGEAVSENEVAGLAERYFHIPTNPEAAEFLERADTFARGWVDQDKIAEHALWLRDNHIHQSQGRFYIKSVDDEVIRMLTTGSGTKSAVCQWLVSYLLSPSVFHAGAKSNLLVRVEDKQLLVNVRGLMAYWDLYITNKNERCPPVGVLARAIAEISEDQRLKMPDKERVRTNYHIIKLENLYSWAQHNGFATIDQIKVALGYPPEPESEEES